MLGSRSLGRSWLAANALPTYFLVFVADFHDEVPDPYPIALGLLTLYVAAGAVLTALVRKAERGRHS